MRLMKNKFYLFLLLFLLLPQTAYPQFSGTKLEELQAKLDSVITPMISRGVTVSAKVMHADYNKVMYEYQPEVKVIPASITKLITSACAFSKLGQSYNIPTVVYTDDNNITDGVVNGNIYLKGFGDPDLNTSDIERLAEIIVSNNIKEITGNIVADESYFDDNYKGLSGYYKGDTGPSYWPYVNALPLNKNEGVSNPATYAAGILSADLTAAGVIVGGVVISGVTPKASKELAQISHSIFDVLSFMNKTSDNHSAITMFKLLGAKYKSNPGTLEEGQEVIESFLTEIGVNRYAFEILEGSGLTRYNQVSADVYMKLLKYMYDDRFLFDYFFNSLAIAGKDGTIRNRMIGTEAEGNVHAKTGTLNGVSALTGYCIDRDSEILIFFIVMNGSGASTNSMRSVQDEFCIQLAEFSRK
ncbi:MAG: D-alanyl-D-alanine carboxypeptidase/D-alanyl-D-alanine-endopeptidase [Ignavibacteriae bacterium]|nr:MAG: D-alanyl-D-alanine carboxypeptidase/D-alanyl-D-alanine-endopeptidase [Ignavibacteriota bacterium]